MTAGISLEKFAPLLRDCVIGRKTKVYETVPSTNSLLVSFASRGAPHGLAVVADAQTEGKGRMGRSWFSPPGLNLHVSVLLRCEWPASRLPLFVYMAGVAVADVLRDAAAIKPFLKWPNDVHYEGRKLCGILCESIPGPSGSDVVMGIGLNVNAEETDFAPELRHQAASLKTVTGKTWDRTGLLASLYLALDRLYTAFRNDPASVLSAWKQYAAIPRVRYTIHAGDERLEGRAVDIAEDGALILEEARGVMRKIYSGDVAGYSIDQ